MGNCIPEISADTVMIYERLVAAKTGEEITKAELDGVIGRRVPSSMLTTARRKALSDNQIVFGTIRGVGIRRMDDSEVVNSSAASFHSIQRATRREARRLSAIRFEGLPDNMKVKHSAAAAALAMINKIAAPQQVKVLESKAADGMRKLSMIQAIDAIRESEGAL